MYTLSTLLLSGYLSPMVSADADCSARSNTALKAKEGIDPFDPRNAFAKVHGLFLLIIPLRTLHMHIHARIHTFTEKDTIHTHTNASTHTHTHTHTCALTRTQTDAYTHTHIHIYTHALTRAHTHAYTHTHMHTHMVVCYDLAPICTRQLHAHTSECLQRNTYPQVTLALSRSRSRPLALSLMLSHTHSHSLTHTRIDAHIHTLTCLLAHADSGSSAQLQDGPTGVRPTQHMERVGR